MSDYKAQVNFSLGDFLFNINGDSAEELDKTVAEMAKAGPSLFENLTALKQAGLAAAAFSANDSKGSVGKAAPAATTQNSLPSESRCPHGPWKDLRKADGSKGTNAKGDPYKFDAYCAAERGDKTKCKEGFNYS